MGKATYQTNGHSSRPLSPHEAIIRQLSDRIVEAQRPIRILDAIKWDDAIEKAFFAGGCRALPPVTRDYYASRPLAFDPAVKGQEFLAIERDLQRQLGKTDELSRIMGRMCREYRAVVAMLAQRGTPSFGVIARQLYGSTQDRAANGERCLADLVECLTEHLPRPAMPCAVEPLLPAREAVILLAQRLRSYFRDPAAVRVRLSDGIVADAAAGCDYIKLRHDAVFSERDLHVLEVHEGWVHLGTTLNGQRQPICTFLGKGPPSSTRTQEGLAVLMEILTSAAHPARIKRLVQRVEGVTLAEAGADFIHVYRYFLERGCTERESYQHTMRIFRGSLPQGGGPFTKDLCYARGLAAIFPLVERSMADQRAQLPLLFCGKTSVTDLPLLAQLVDEGLISAPRYVPPPFVQMREVVGSGGSSHPCVAHVTRLPVDDSVPVP